MSQIDETERLLCKDNKGTDKDQPSSLNPRSYLIGVVLSVYYFSQGMVVYIQSEWIQHYMKLKMFGNDSDSAAQKGCEDTNHSDPSYELYTNVQEQTARWQMYNVLGGSISVLLVLPFLPSLSDHVGRKFLFILGLTSAFIKYSLLAAIIYFKFGLIWIVFVIVLDGFSGAYYTIVSGASSFIADITKRSGSRRTIGLTVIESLMLVNVTLSSISIGYLINFTGFFIPTVGCAIATFLSIIILTTCVPESLELERRSTKTTACGYLRRTFDFYGSELFRGKRTAYILLIVAYFIEMMATTNRANIETIYQLGMPFCWKSEKIGIFSAVRHAAQGFVGPLFLLPLKWCFSDLQIGILSALSNGGSFILEGLATNTLILFLVNIPAIFSFLTVPMIKSIMSLMTPVDKQGSLFAGIMCVECTCLIITNFVSNMMYSATVSIMHGFTFLVLGGTCGLVVILLGIFGVTQKPDTTDNIPEKHINQPEA